MQSKTKNFRAVFVTARYWVNAAIIVTLIALPSFHVIKFDFANGKFYLFGSQASVISTASAFLSLWAGSYVLTLLADYFFGRLFCGWICTWGTLLRSLSYARDKAKRKKIPAYGPHAIAIGAASLSTFGLMNWFVDMSVTFRPNHAAFVWVTSSFVIIDALSVGMLWKVGLKFCQVYCPIGWYLTAVSQKHMMRLDFAVPDCTYGEVCVRECPMAMDPRLLATDTDTDSHALCILCGDCLSACNACAAKVEGGKPITLELGIMPVIPIISREDLAKGKADKRKPKSQPKPVMIATPVIILKSAVKEPEVSQMQAEC